MAQVEKTVLFWKCERCGYDWFPRDSGEPKKCPACKSPYWNSQRKPGSKAPKAKSRKRKS